jgi:hypothetical protein
VATSGKPLDEGTRNRIIRLLREEFTYRQVAGICRVCLETVRKIAREMGIAK